MLLFSFDPNDRRLIELKLQTGILILNTAETMAMFNVWPNGGSFLKNSPTNPSSFPGGIISCIFSWYNNEMNENERPCLEIVGQNNKTICFN